MSGVKGKSGRKPDPNTEHERYKKISFYVKEYAVLDAQFNIVKWTEDPTFQWFKRHHSASWQNKVRGFMYEDVRAFKDIHWRCKCENIGILGNYKHPRESKCYVCNTWKNEATRRIHER
jgi:hypothetical protein